MNAMEYNICVDEWADRLYRFGVKTIADKEEARDIVQQSFETLWVKREEVPYEKAKSFLFTVAHRRCMDVYRKQKIIVQTEQAENIRSVTDNHDLKNYLNTAIKNLDKQSQTLIFLKDYEGYNYEEISSITKLSLTQVKVYLHRARKSLKNYLLQNKEIL